jgi:3,4-dihydroxy 2-butanone 4-phosphate synthase/GTP cyclohydrolase II
MNELAVTHMACARIPTPEGEFKVCLFVNGQDNKEHLALVAGDVTGQDDVLVRVHSECFTGDVLGSLRCDCGVQLEESMNLIAKEGAGILIYLRQEGRGIGLANKLRAYNLQEQGYDTVDANLLLGYGADERDYTTAALILKHLGVRSVRLITNNPTKIESLELSGIEVSERVPLPSYVTAENAAYLLTKVRRMRHLLNLDAHTTALKEHENGNESAASEATEATDFLNTQSCIPVSDGIELLRAKIAGHQQDNRPFVTLSYAQSLDGCIAGRPGQQLVLSSSQSLVLTHKLRAAHDAILVGIGTVLADNPRLTVRLVEGQIPQPVILDSHLRLPLDVNLLRNHPLRPLIVTSEQADIGRQKVLEEAGARVLRLPSDERGRVRLPLMLERLRELGIKSLMVEGGARIITSFLSERLVNHMILTVAPVFVGGMRGVRRLNRSDTAFYPHLSNLQHQPVGKDMIFWGDPVWEG